MLLQLGFDVLRDQVDGHNVVPPLPGDDEVGKPPAGCHVLVKRGLDKLCVLLQHAVDVASPGRHVALDSAREPYVIIWCVLCVCVFDDDV